jgi:hypothetical protein
LNEPQITWSTIVRNEFAIVELALQMGPSGPELRIRDLHRDGSVTLDALELEGLCWLSSADRMKLLAPQRRYEGDSS